MTVHFVGAGPGAADLLTLRAVELLRTTPVCLYAGTYIDAEILAHCPDDAELVDTQHLDLDQIIAHLVDADRRGLDAVRLCSGDPSLYSALTEQTRRLDEAGVAWDVTPGVPAHAAAAALLGTELTVRGGADGGAYPHPGTLHENAGIGGVGERREDPRTPSYLAIRHIRVLAEQLVPEYGADCLRAVVAHATRPNELVLRGTLTDIADHVEAAGLRHTAVILVGRALASREWMCRDRLLALVRPGP